MLSLQALLLAAILSMDVFAVSFAYGSNKISIPPKSIAVITLIGKGILAASIYLGAILLPFMPESLANALSFTILFTLGIAKIFDSIIKQYIRKNNTAKQLTFSALNLKFIINVYADPEKADADNSRIINAKEAVVVAIAVALDAFALGFGAGLTDISALQLIAFSMIIGVAAILAGGKIAGKIAQKTPINLSWLGAVILIVLAVI